MRRQAGTAVSRTCLVLLLVTPLLMSSSAPGLRGLTFEERIAAQEAIERIYHSHQVGDRRTFEAAVPREVLEHKVRTYLKQSAALETFWRTPVTGEMLEAELARIARGTRLPERLLEIYDVLRHDPVLIRECF